MSDMSIPPPGPAAIETGRRIDPLREAARKLEAGFLAEMLKGAGYGETRKAFGGGAGEEQFGSFLRQAQAEAMVENGGVGLAESLFQALKEKTDD